HAHLAADERRVTAHDQPVVSRHLAADLAGTRDREVTRDLELAFDSPRNAQVTFDEQLADQPVVGSEDYRVAVAVGPVLCGCGERGLLPTGRTLGAQSHPSERCRSAWRHRRS